MAKAKAKYQVLRGSHAEGFYPAGHPLFGKPIVYEAGDVLETENCLLKLNSPGHLGPKFKLVDDDRVSVTDKLRAQDDESQPAAPQPADGLSTMTTAELKELARGDGIELGAAKTKAEITKVLRDAYAATAATA
jgi:hypothetical protein